MRFLLILLLGIFCTACQAQLAFSLPLNSLKLTSGFGSRIHPVTGKKDYHKGIDLSARCEPVLSVLPGTVSSSGFNPILGNFVTLDHGDIETIYGHLRMIAVQAGQVVDNGEFLGVTGSTGRSTGEHLHFAVRFQGNYLDPLAFLLGLSKFSDAD